MSDPTIRDSLDSLIRQHPALCARRCRRSWWRGVQHSSVCEASRDLIYATRTFIEAAEPWEADLRDGRVDGWLRDDFKLAAELLHLQTARYLRLATA